jgi:hypothetical protein
MLSVESGAVLEIRRIENTSRFGLTCSYWLRIVTPLQEAYHAGSSASKFNPVVKLFVSFHGYKRELRKYLGPTL